MEVTHKPCDDCSSFDFSCTGRCGRTPEQTTPEHRAYMSRCKIVAWLIPTVLFAAAALCLFIGLMPPCGRPC